MYKEILKSSVLLACEVLTVPMLAQKHKPNVLLLFSDQHNKRVMGYEGHPDVITPNFDKLVNESIVFDRAYCSVGISAPSRMSLMSGLYPRTMGILSNEGTTSVTNRDAVSLATIFQMNGYDTYAFGKRHTDGAVDEGWMVKKDHLNLPDEENYVKWVEEQGLLHEFSLDWAAEFGRGPKGTAEFKNKYPTADLGTRMSALPENATMEAWTAMNTIEMIRSRKDEVHPFFCWATFYHPHQPYTPQKKYMDRYDITKWGKGTRAGEGIRKPHNFYHPTDQLPPELQNQRNGRNKVWNMDKAFADEQIWRNYIGAYYALVTEVDHWVGEIISALEEEGLEDETIVIYTADHGDFVGNHGMVEKCAVGHNIYEDILNIPLIFRYPGKTEGRNHNNELVSLVDIYPTLVDLLNLNLPKDMKYDLQGESLREVILEDAPLKRKFLVSESWSQAAVITKDCKLGIWKDPTVVHPKWDYRSFGDQFFNYEEGQPEVINEIDDPQNKKKVKKLRKYYKTFTESVSDAGLKERIAAAMKNNKTVNCNNL